MGRQTGGNLPRNVNVVRVQASRDELDAGVLLYVVHSLGDGETVVLTEVVRESVGNLKTIIIISNLGRSLGRIILHCLSARERSCTDQQFSSGETESDAQLPGAECKHHHHHQTSPPCDWPGHPELSTNVVFPLCSRSGSLWPPSWSGLISPPWRSGRC